MYVEQKQKKRKKMWLRGIEKKIFGNKNGMEIERQWKRAKKEISRALSSLYRLHPSD
jgi:hypothetical protein